jgi:DNA modification methylase
LVNSIDLRAISTTDENLLVSFNTNKLFYGDNLEILRSNRIPNESIDLIYLDPPFNSKADYNILFKETTGEQSAAQIQAFTDFWHWDDAAREAFDYLVSNDVDNKVASVTQALLQMLGKNDMTAYLMMMLIRLIELHRVLKPTGSLYLHCDPTASHYLKLGLDAIFGAKNFRNEVIWKRTSAHVTADKWGRVHDTIFYYTKGDNYTWSDTTTQPYREEYLASKYRYQDERGRYRLSDITGPGITSGPSGQAWRGYDPSKFGRHFAVSQQALEQLRTEGFTVPDEIDAQLELLYQHGYIKFSVGKNGSKGNPQYKVYLPKKGGVPLQDLIADIPPINSQAQERLGYPTQKPVKLLERLIDASSKKGDWILDPFCGCGTAISASEKLERHWIGIDITWLAINLVKNRLRAEYPDARFEVEGEPKDIGAAKDLAKNRYQFQWWALSLIGARPVGAKQDNPREGKKGADDGIDGWLRFRDGDKVESIVVQVKSGHVSVKDIRELRDVVRRQRAAMGVFLTLSDPTSEMIKETKVNDPYIMKTLQLKYPMIQISTIEQLLRGIKPELPATSSAFEQAVLVRRASNKANYRLDDMQMQS